MTLLEKGKAKKLIKQFDKSGIDLYLPNMSKNSPIFSNKYQNDNLNIIQPEQLQYLSSILNRFPNEPFTLQTKYPIYKTNASELVLLSGSRSALALKAMGKGSRLAGSRSIGRIGFNPLSVTGGIFAMASVITGQYYLRTINKQLKDITSSMESIENRLDSEEIGTIKGCLAALQDLQDKTAFCMQTNNVMLKQACLNELFRIRTDLLKIMSKSRQIAEDLSSQEIGKNKHNLDRMYNKITRQFGIFTFALFSLSNTDMVNNALNIEFLTPEFIDKQSQIVASRIKEYEIFQESIMNKIDRQVEELNDSQEKKAVNVLKNFLSNNKRRENIYKHQEEQKYNVAEKLAFIKNSLEEGLKEIEARNEKLKKQISEPLYIEKKEDGQIYTNFSMSEQ